MDPSAILRLQSRNKIHSDFLRMKNEHNKIPADAKSSKLMSAPHLSKQDGENKDPGSSEMSRKAPARAGISRLPVLAKSLHLQTPSDFSQSHCRWEEKPLAGKSKKKKPCTRPVPFNLSQPKSSTTRKNQQPASVPQSQTGTHAVQLKNNAHLKHQNIHSKPSKHPAVLNCHMDSTQKSHGKTTENMSHLLGQSRPPNTSKASATLSNPLPAIALRNTRPQISSSSTSAHPALTNCLENMNLLSLKDPTKIKPASQNTELSTVKGENFQPDHMAFLSILRNEGIKATGLGSTTPQSKSYNYVPQRVSVMKSRQKVGATTGISKLVQFSPDATALQSILQNEGVTAGGLVGATPRKSVCPSGRSTSVYTARRVPLRKNHAEATGGSVAVTFKETPLRTWTPQRVPDTRRQPISAMKWHQSTKQTPYVGTPGLKSCKTDLQPQQEQEVVQRLFDDQDEDLEENATQKHPDTQTDQLTVQASSTKPHCEEKFEKSKANTSEEEEEKEEERVGRQPFLQAPERESVIFFSTGKNLSRAPHFEKQKSSCEQQQQQQQQQMPCVSELPRPVNPSLQSLHRDTVVPKTCGVSHAVALLRKRLPPLEELRMDEEVATYTSVSVHAAPGFVLPRPRCGNPLASILHFEESCRFVPISFDVSSGPSSPLSSPKQER
ncbi:hypothetical protein JOB18_021166 [Solea senegalensis]|uniref:Uncharacterized protein n=1 Tax=Solea senegalensis TaxID=28829 RepID=A0AAV6SST0_SOLSE|nr:uncharacterized protein LOC122777086 isoform X1 [Solea senegalensis]KAG7520025.1 hypothetical protein JOB18_021166 [Solea senegalensis]